LGIYTPCVILCEGPSDPLFISTLAKHFNVDISRVQIEPSSSLCSSTAVQHLVSDLFSSTQLRKAQVRFLRDPDFRLNPKTNTDEFFWELPSIESFLFVYHIKQQRIKKTPSSLAFFLDAKNQQIFATKYTNSFRSQNKEEGLHHMLFNWHKAIEAAKNPEPSDDDIVAVARVLHGHTWVEDVLESTTAQLILDLQADVTALIPSVGPFIHKLVTFN